MGNKEWEEIIKDLFKTENQIGAKFAFIGGDMPEPSESAIALIKRLLAQAEKDFAGRVKEEVIGEDEYCDDWCGDVEIDVCTCGAEWNNELREKQRQALNKLLSSSKEE